MAIESINTVIRRMEGSKTLPTKMQVNSCYNVLQSAREVLPPAAKKLKDEYPSIEDFLKAFNPSKQMEVYDDPDQCFFGDSPTLALLNTTYGKRAAEAWLIPEVEDACLFCGLKELPDKMQLEKLVKIIVANFWYLNVEELLLFFFRFCSARYRRFYAYFDPSVIILSLQDFLRERNHAYNVREQKLHEQEWKRSRKEAITYEEYLRRKEEGSL